MLLPRVNFANGESVSIQAGESHYCVPRTAWGPYSCVELGFPSFVPDPSVLVYAEEESDPTHTVYGYVPIDLVKDMIKENGGMLDTPENFFVCYKLGLSFSESVEL